MTPGEAQSAARALPAALEAEIGALLAMTFGEAVDAINGRLGRVVGLRGKYLRELDRLCHAGNASDTLRQSVGAEINRLCDRAIQLRTPIQDAATRWTSYPTDLLTPEEKETLT